VFVIHCITETARRVSGNIRMAKAGQGLRELAEDA
jgi:hypothetical protein